MNRNLEVTIEGEFRLSGTLTIPEQSKAKYPAVLIIAGSGKGDRDGNNKELKTNMYKEQADFLTEKGFATLRYDKRGTYKSEGNFLEAGVQDLINDASACVRFLQNHGQVDKEKIFILGHSEGALIAPAVHRQTPVSGLILLAGAARPNFQILPLQNERAYAELNQLPGLKGWLIRKLRITEKARRKNMKVITKILESDKNVMRIQGAKINAKWLRETVKYNVCDYLRETDCPVLAVTGEKDIQVPPEDVERVADFVRGEVEWKIIPDMNHILRPYEGEHTILNILKEYKTTADKPLAQELLMTIENWLNRYS